MPFSQRIVNGKCVLFHFVTRSERVGEWGITGYGVAVGMEVAMVRYQRQQALWRRKGMSTHPASIPFHSPPLPFSIPSITLHIQITHSPTPPVFKCWKCRQHSFHTGHEIMKTFTIWDILLLLEAICYIVFILLVALEFCSTSFSMYCLT